MAGLAAWIGGESVRGLFEIPVAAESRGGASTFGILGAILGLSLGLAGGLARRQPPPNSKRWAFGACRTDRGGCGTDDSSFANTSSNHSGGVNALMCDGSVKFLKDAINMRTYMAIGTRANSEVVATDAF